MVALKWVRYSGTNSRYILFLVINEYNNKLCGLVADNIADQDIKQVKLNLGQLNQMSPKDRYSWFAHHIAGFSSLYKEINVSNCSIENEYAINGDN